MDIDINIRHKSKQNACCEMDKGDSPHNVDHEMTNCPPPIQHGAELDDLVTGQNLELETVENATSSDNGSDTSDFQEINMCDQIDDEGPADLESNDSSTNDASDFEKNKDVDLEENIDFPEMDESNIEEQPEQKSATVDKTASVGTSILRHRLDPEPPRDDDKTKAAAEDAGPSGSSEKRKIAMIKKALDSNPVDIESLRKLAISPGGLINKSMRQRAWPLLINVNTNNITPKPSHEEMVALSQTYNQVVMDVNRSSSRFPPGIDDHVRMSMKDKLVDLIMRVMLKRKDLKYYQGFHDVCITFLLCMDEDLAFAMVDKLAMGYMREYLDETMERTSLLLNYVYPLVNKCNPELCQHMERSGLGTIFALSWVITWFSHVLGDIRRILRVFDFFLASHRLMPVYLSAAFVLHRERDIYEAGEEMGYIHKCLSTIPPDLPLESLLERAGDLYLQYPPTEISSDPMLIRMNRQVFEHFNRIDSRNASRRLAQQATDTRNSLFVKVTMWTVTAVVGVAAAVLYHAYSGHEWDLWNSLS
ncbi:TBC1 domain family member 20-like [Physella acuta]|uniref:TBC1 domain family member 20-like n=1 Tax=Physella acuta TaxID=109671 RepID=UPI0027DDBE73|nr:TBC1 domain family member 20-like [Physella acuta]XP_059171225.1 TBC1 domain family member 20-like [Physella acuta]